MKFGVRTAFHSLLAWPARFAACSFATLFVILAGAASAHATTQFVGAFVGLNTDCSSPGFTRVQDAVDAAASGDTVHLCGTTPFAEQVIITKSITLTGDEGATIQAPSPFPATPLSRLPPQFMTDNLFVPEAIVIVWGAGVNATITDLIITGPLPGNGGCADEEYGVLVIADAAASLVGDQVFKIADSNTSLYGCQFGIGVQVGREFWPKSDFSTFLVEDFVGSGTVTTTTASGYQKGGIVVDGPGSSGLILNNTIEGSNRDNSFSPIIAQNGIQISRGASSQVRGNTVSGNTYTGTAPASAAGVLVFGGCGDPLVTGVQVMKNTLTNNDVGIYLNNLDPTCSFAASSMTNDKAVNNTITNDAVTNRGPFMSSPGSPVTGTFCGYQAGVDEIGTNDKVINNDISGVGYTPPAPTAGCGPFVAPVDTETTLTNNPKVHANTSK